MEKKHRNQQQTRKQKRAQKFGHKIQKPVNKQKLLRQQKGQPEAPAAPVKKTLKTKGNEQLPTIQNMLQIKKDDRVAKSAEYFKKVLPFLDSYMQRKMGSRVIQLMFKWGTPEIKASIHRSILKNWKDLIKSKYALHAISKVSSEFEFPRLAEDAVALQNHKQGSLLLEIFINTHHGSPQCSQIYNKFEQIARKYTEGTDKNFETQQILHNLAMKSIEKAYYSNKISKLIIKLALPTMVQEERVKVIEFFSDKVFELFTDEEGVKLFIQLYNYFDSKQKKTIVLKQIKGRVAEMLRMCKISYVALIKLMTQTDDTVMISNKIVPELLEGLVASESTMKDEGAEVQEGQEGENAPQVKKERLRNTFISLLSPRNNNFNCLGKIEKTLAFTTAKKPEEQRKQEIRAFLYPSLVQYVVREENIQRMCTDLHDSKVTLGIIKSMQADSSELLKDLATKILKFFIKDLESHKQQGSKKIQVSQSLTANNFGSKILKNILLLQEPFIDKYCDRLSEIFKANLNETLHCNASFVLTILIEKGRTELLEEIRRSKIDLGKVRAGDFYLKELKGKGK